jgi:hypothetical protein
MLCAGASYRKNPKRRYNAYIYDIADGPLYEALLLPQNQAVLARLEPEAIRQLGSPGDGLVIARKVANGIHFWIGYLGWEGQPVFIADPKYNWSNVRDWEPKQMVGLHRQELGWLRDRVDDRTLAIMFERSRAARDRYREKRVRELMDRERRKAFAESRRVQKERNRVKRERRRAWALAVLDNLVAIETGISAELVKRGMRSRKRQSELDDFAAQWTWY